MKVAVRTQSDAAYHALEWVGKQVDEIDVGDVEIRATHGNNDWSARSAEIF